MSHDDAGDRSPRPTAAGIRTGQGDPPAAGGVSTVTTELSFDVSGPTTLVLQVAVAAGRAEVDDHLEVRSDGGSVDVSVVDARAGGRQHVLRTPGGALSVRYEARVGGSAGTGAEVSLEDRLEALRPSRYCPSDAVLGFAGAEFGSIGPVADRVRAVCDYVASRVVYTVGASGPTTDAVETLLSGAGVCRDYAHTVAMLCRAAGVPARVASVYAPGLSPMDMHAVVEAEIDGVWTVWDATRLAPRPTLVRIATGRDAADTAFVTVVDGRADLDRMWVTATAPGDLPWDDHRELVVLS